MLKYFIDLIADLPILTLPPQNNDIEIEIDLLPTSISLTKREGSEIYQSITQTGYLDINSAIGCSGVMNFSKDPIQCIKKFLNKVKHPLSDCIGFDLAYPLYKILEPSVSKATHADKVYFNNKLEISSETGTPKGNLLKFLHNKLEQKQVQYLECEKTIYSKYN